MERFFMDPLMPIKNLYVCVNSVCLCRLCIFCFFSSLLWIIHLLQKRLGSVNAWTADLHLYLMECSRLCSQTGRLGDFKLNSGKSPVMFCLVPPRIQWETSNPQNKLVSSGWWSTARSRDERALRATEIRGHYWRRERARRVQSVAAQDRNSHSTADRTRTRTRTRIRIRTRIRTKTRTRTRTERVSLGQ